MELQLVAHISTNEEGIKATVKKLTGDSDGILLIQLDTNRIPVSITELKDAIKKLEDFNDGQTTK